MLGSSVWPLAAGPFGHAQPARTQGTKRGATTDIMNVPGLYVPSRDAPRPMSRQEVEQHRDWKKIPRVDIETALLYYDSDPLVNEAVQMKLNHILGAGITFKRRGSVMSPAAVRWHSTTYTTLLRNIYRYWLSCGFAVWTTIPHAEYTGEPVILDLLKVDVFMLSDLYSRVHFKFFPVKDGVVTTQYGKLNSDQELQNMFIVNFHPPDASGQIKSIADVLEDDFRFEQQLQADAAMACHLKSFPPIVTQHVSEKHQLNEQRSAYSIAPPSVAQVDSAVSSVAATNGPIVAGTVAPHVEQERSNQAAEAVNRYNRKSKQLQSYIRNTGIHQLMNQNQVFLPTDRTVARVDAPQEPERYIEFCQKRRDDVYAYFSIPPGVVAAAGGGSQRSATTGSSANSMTVFINDQKQLKNLFLSITQEIYHAITYSVDVLALVMDGVYDKRRKLSNEQIKEQVETEIEMPGIPEDDVVYQLYLLGILNYETVCSIMGGKHGLAKSSFNPRPVIDVKLLNGIKPEEKKVPNR